MILTYAFLFCFFFFFKQKTAYEIVSGDWSSDVCSSDLGGWVGWLGYEDAAARAGAPVSVEDAEAPAERWLRVESYVAFDHARRRVWAVAPAADAPAFAARAAAADGRLPTVEPAPAEAVARHTPIAYAALIER